MQDSDGGKYILQLVPIAVNYVELQNTPHGLPVSIPIVDYDHKITKKNSTSNYKSRSQSHNPKKINVSNINVTISHSTM